MIHPDYMKNLKCPFCKSKNIGYKEEKNGKEASRFFCFCENCRATGPVMNTAIEATLMFRLWEMEK
jgi:uncharacterized protein YbaR (Trm112 family)